MIQFAEQLSYTLQEQLQAIALGSKDGLHKATRSFRAVNEALLKLKEFIVRYTFSSNEEEILFFKEIKPVFYKQLIYWSKIIQLENGKPIGSKKRLREYYQQNLQVIDMFFMHNRPLYNYYRMGNCTDDEVYFLRTAVNTQPTAEYSLDLDPSFSTVMSVRLAEILAFQDLVVYIEYTLNSIGAKSKDADSVKPPKPVMFTGTKAQFIEFVYSLQSFGVLNNGKTDIKEAMEWFQYCLGIQVSNYYGYFQSMRIRKKDRTPFLNALIKCLARRMDESDEFPRFS